MNCTKPAKNETMLESDSIFNIQQQLMLQRKLHVSLITGTCIYTYDTN